MTVRLIEVSPQGKEKPGSTYADELAADKVAQANRLAALKAGTLPKDLPRYRIVPA